MVEWRTATPISLGAALFFGLLVVDFYGGTVDGLQTSYERFLSHISSERRMLLSKQDAASKAPQELSSLYTGASSGASRSLQTQISQHEDPSQQATSSDGAHTYNGAKLGRNVLSATTEQALAQPAETIPPPQNSVSSTSLTKKSPRFVLQNIFRRSILTEEDRWTQKVAQQHMANTGTGMTGKARNLLDQVYVSPEKPVDSGSDFWVEKKAQQDNANRGTGVTATSRNLLDQVYVSPEKPIDSGSDFWEEKKAQQDNANRGTGVTAQSRNLLDQVYWSSEDPTIAEEQLSDGLVSDANGGSSSTANPRNLLSTDAASIWEQKQAQQRKADRGLFTTSTARDLLAAPPTHTTKHHAQIPCFSQWTTRLQPGMLPTNFPRITPSQRLNVHSASSLGATGGLVNVTLVSPSQLLFSFNASTGYYPSSAALILKDGGPKAKPERVTLTMAGKATSPRNASLSSGDTTSAAAFQRVVAHLGNGSAVLAVSLKPTASSKMNKTLALNGTLQHKCPLFQGSNHTETYQNSNLACTYPGYTSSFTIPRGVSVTTRLLQACSVAPESVAVATALSAQDSFPGWTSGSSICVPKGCPQSLAKPTPPSQQTRSPGYGTDLPYSSHSHSSNPDGGYGSVYAGIYGQPVRAPAASTSTKHTGKPGHTEPAPSGSRGMVNKTAAGGSASLAMASHPNAGLSKAPSAAPQAAGGLHTAHGSAKARAAAHPPAHSPAPAPGRLHKPAHDSSVHPAASRPPAKSKSSGGFFSNMFSYEAGTAKAPSPRVSKARSLSDAPAPSIWKTVEGTLEGAVEEVTHTIKSATSTTAQPPADLFPALEADTYTRVATGTVPGEGPAPAPGMPAVFIDKLNLTAGAGEVPAATGGGHKHVMVEAFTESMLAPSAKSVSTSAGVTNTTPAPAPSGSQPNIMAQIAEPGTSPEATTRPVNGTLECTSKGFNRVYQIPSNCSGSVPDLLQQECGVSPESVAFASAQNWTINFKVFKPGSSICVPADCDPCGAAATAPAAPLPHPATNSTRHIATSYNSQGFPVPSNTTASGTPLPANVSIISFATASGSGG